MSTMASQITSLTTVYSTPYSGWDQRKHQSSASLAFVRGIHRWPVNSPHKGPVTRKMYPFDDVIMRHKTTVLRGIPHLLFLPKTFATSSSTMTRYLMIHNTAYTQWRHNIDTLSALLTLCKGNHWSSVERASDAVLWCFPWVPPK